MTNAQFYAVAISGVASAVITTLITSSNWPPVHMVRSWLLARWPGTPPKVDYADTKKHWKENKYRRPYSFGYLLTCRMCMGFWVSLVLIYIVQEYPVSRETFVLHMGAWGVSTWVSSKLP